MKVWPLQSRNQNRKFVRIVRGLLVRRSDKAMLFVPPYTSSPNKGIPKYFACARIYYTSIKRKKLSITRMRWALLVDNHTELKFMNKITRKYALNNCLTTYTKVSNCVLNGTWWVRPVSNLHWTNAEPPSARTSITLYLIKGNWT